MSDKKTAYLKAHVLTKAAMEATRWTFEQLLERVTLTPGDPDYPECWPISFNYTKAIPPESFSAVQSFMLLVWFFSPPDPFDETLRRDHVNTYLVKEEYSLAWDTGHRVQKGAADGHEQTHGTDAEKKERWDDMQTKLNEKMQRNEHLGITEARRQVATALEVSLKTVCRHTTNPRKN